MTSRRSKRIPILWVLTFILFCLVASHALAQTDSADIAIISTTGYPGYEDVYVEVWLKNGDFAISGFQFMITMSNNELIDFHTDSIAVDTIVIPVDTCTWEPDSLHGDTCFVDSLIPTAVRFCSIDTAGCLTSGFDFIECHGDTGDTSSSECNWIQILGMAPYGEPIEPYPGGWRCLLRFGVDLPCLPDSTTDRTTSFYISPGGFSFLADPGGHLVPFRYTQGNFIGWRALAGDANADSIVQLGDVMYLVNYLYRNGPVPCVPEAGDANGSCLVELGDVVQLIEYLYRNGPPPLEGCWYGDKRK